jgi:V/A-type H+-transporting ATPase subunit I
MRRVIDALVENGAWILMLTAILALMFSSDISLKMSLVASASPLLGSAFIAPSYAVISAMSIVIILFGARNEKSVFFRFFIGFLKLVVLSGIFSYMGDILSYIRLMALGMVTAGIAMAVNTIAFMMVDIPVAGYFLTGIILVAGHLFNLAINLLGGFVHTLRLQYVEFYSRFFIGGGKPFLPFSNNEKYIKIIE